MGTPGTVRRNPVSAQRKDVTMNRQRTTLGMLVAAPLLLMALVACGPEDDSTSIATAGGAAAHSATARPSIPKDRQEQRLQLAQCLRDHGINVPDPDANGQPGGGGAAAIATQNPDKFNKAMDACRQFAGGADVRRTFSPEDQQKMLEYTQCLRAHGVEISDPDASSGRAQLQNLTKARNDPNFPQAQKECAQVQPKRLNDLTSGGSGR
jgi:hypothetical protein